MKRALWLGFAGWFIAAIGIIGCGGGTTGTGGTNFTGSILDAGGAPLSSVRVQIAGTDQGATTDSNGNFEFNAEVVQQDIEVVFETGQVTTNLLIQEVPGEASSLIIDVVIDESSGSGENAIVESNVEIIIGDNPQPQTSPTPTPAPTAIPTPVPTPLPQQPSTPSEPVGPACGSMVCQQGEQCCDSTCDINFPVLSCAPANEICLIPFCEPVIDPPMIICGNILCSADQNCCPTSCIDPEFVCVPAGTLCEVDDCTVF